MSSDHAPTLLKHTCNERKEREIIPSSNAEFARCRATRLRMIGEHNELRAIKLKLTIY